MDRPKCNQDITAGNEARSYLQYHTRGSEMEESAGIGRGRENTAETTSRSKHRGKSAASEEVKLLQVRGGGDWSPQNVHLATLILVLCTCMSTSIVY
jgi:hypothetical protein